MNSLIYRTRGKSVTLSRPGLATTVCFSEIQFLLHNFSKIFPIGPEMAVEFPSNHI